MHIGRKEPNVSRIIFCIFPGEKISENINAREKRNIFVLQNNIIDFLLKKSFY